MSTARYLLRVIRISLVHRRRQQLRPTLARTGQQVLANGCFRLKCSNGPLRLAIADSRSQSIRGRSPKSRRRHCSDGKSRRRLCSGGLSATLLIALERAVQELSIDVGFVCVRAVPQFCSIFQRTKSRRRRCGGSTRVDETRPKE